MFCTFLMFLKVTLAKHVSATTIHQRVSLLALCKTFVMIDSAFVFGVLQSLTLLTRLVLNPVQLSAPFLCPGGTLLHRLGVCKTEVNLPNYLTRHNGHTSFERLTKASHI